MKQLVILIAIFISASTYSCQKEEKLETKFANGIVKDYGEPAVDGCGWLIEISSKLYKPQNLTEDFQVDNLGIELKYTLLNTKATCGLSSMLFDEINIVEIEKK